MSEKVLRKNSVGRVCNERILSAYPVHKQLNLMREGGHDLGCMDAWINAQRVACKVHERAIDGLDEDSLELRDYDIHAGWPDEVDAPDAEDTSRLETVQQELSDLKQKLDERPETIMPDDERKVSGYRFKVPFLQAERLVNEDLNDADKRLFDEYTKLELSRPLEPSDDARWRLLQAGFFEFRG
jgi:hypothetical protein